MERSIIHLNIADFAAAVETRLAPSLEGYPLVIAPFGSPRAVVYDMSEEAFCQGIRKGMPLARVKRLNRDIRLVAPSFNRYEQVMRDLLKETLSLTPLIESGNQDGHIFMDVTGSSRLFGPPPDMAFRLKKAFKRHFGLDPIWSVATSKLVAKVATRLVKPVGEYIVSPGDESAFLSPLPVRLIPDLETADLKTLDEFNLSRVSEARMLTLEQLRIPFRQRATLIYDRLRGIDPTPVALFCEKQSSLVADHEFPDDTNHADQLKRALYLLVETLGRRLRKQALHASFATLVLSYSDGLQKTASTRITPATANDMSLFKHGARLLEKAWTRRVRIRHMRLSCQKIQPQPVQARLFAVPGKETKAARILPVMDRVRSRFGRNAVMPAIALAPGSGRS